MACHPDDKLLGNAGLRLASNVTLHDKADKPRTFLVRLRSGRRADFGGSVAVPGGVVVDVRTPCTLEGLAHGGGPLDDAAGHHIVHIE